MEVEGKGKERRRKGGYEEKEQAGRDECNQQMSAEEK